MNFKNTCTFVLCVLFGWFLAVEFAGTADAADTSPHHPDLEQARIAL